MVVVRITFDPDRSQRIGQILDAALACDPRYRLALVEAMCGEQPDVCREVLDLLARVDKVGGFLETPPSAVAAAFLKEVHEGRETSAGRVIGAYRIEREIGRGGMSRVFLAQRADGQFEQHVALKLLRPGLDTDLDRARFRAERQILASLNHPNIARLLDGGLADTGEPFLVLEYVEGEPIDAYCDARALPVPARVELFLHAAEATQYAHRNLVVHRDIKTSNILVSVDGGVKLLDFGLAKLLEPSVAGSDASMTQTTVRWMTPEYAAPEQIRRERVTTLTDVYQLGVVLYRLLAGRLPFTVPSGDLRELEAAVLKGGAVSPSIAAVKELSAHAKSLRGDLDAIVLKALRTEPAERFASVEAFADDLRRHLSGHPVLARHNTALYRARRFVRRHRAETVAALGISLSLLAGASAALWQAHRVAKERDLVAAASRESQAVTSFVMGLFETSDPAEARGDTLTAAELVRRAAARAQRLDGPPDAQARMLEVTSRLYVNLGRFSQAYDILERALAIRRQERARNPLALSAALVQMADVLNRVERFAAADSSAREALDIEETVLGHEHPAVATTLHQLANIAVYRGDLAVAEADVRRALGVRNRGLGPNDSLTAESHLTLGAILRREGRFVEAEGASRTGLTILERALVPNEARVASALLQVAYLLDEDEGRYVEADPLYRRALAMRRVTYGEGHPMVAATLLDYADFLCRRGDCRNAVAPGRSAVDIVRRAYGPEHPVVADFTGSLALVLYRAGRLDEAATLFQSAIDMDRRLRGASHGSVAGLEVGLARVLIDRRAFQRAELELRDAIHIREVSAGPTNPVTAVAEGVLGMLLTREGRYPAADSVLRHALQTMERQVGREHPDVRELYGWLADLDDAEGRHDEAVRYRIIAHTR